jgi:hypothetical protein
LLGGRQMKWPPGWNILIIALTSPILNNTIFN